MIALIVSIIPSLFIIDRAGHKLPMILGSSDPSPKLLIRNLIEPGFWVYYDKLGETNRKGRSNSNIQFHALAVCFIIFDCVWIAICLNRPHFIPRRDLASRSNYQIILM